MINHAKISCFGISYSPRARECQTCKLSINCWKRYITEFVDGGVESGYAISIFEFIAKRPGVTVEDINKAMAERFNKKFNIYYYLTILKEKSLIAVKIIGKKRVYMVR